MKFNRTTIAAFVLLILISALYRAVPGHFWGFTPQIAMAVFGGSVIKDRKLSFALPLLSLFISDLIYQVFYINGLGSIPGFYEGQLMNYVLFASLTVVGFFVRERKVVSILAGAMAAPTIYFLISNFLVWMEGGGYARPKTSSGLFMCYTDGLPFYSNSLIGTVFFCAILFGGYQLVRRFIFGSDQAISA
jgi:hypothetical protein